MSPENYRVSRPRDHVADRSSAAVTIIPIYLLILTEAKIPVLFNQPFFTDQSFLWSALGAFLVCHPTLGLVFFFYKNISFACLPPNTVSILNRHKIVSVKQLLQQRQLLDGTKTRSIIDASHVTHTSFPEEVVCTTQRNLLKFVM